MTVLLDENFPLALLRALRRDGIEAEHIITLGCRGIPDAQIRERLRTEDLLFLTQDVEFLVAEPEAAALVVVSRLRQSQPLADRISLWSRAVHTLLQGPQAARVFELTETGQLSPWRSPSR